MELPSAEDYPDYYEVIERPVSMGQIKRKKYGTPAEFKQDFVTMFENAKEYNEATSQMYPKKEIPKKGGGGGNRPSPNVRKRSVFTI
jgi:hypothetical protein